MYQVEPYSIAVCADQQWWDMANVYFNIYNTMPDI